MPFYFSDFVYFNYTIDDVFNVTRHVDSPEIVEKRKKNRRKLKEKYIFTKRKYGEQNGKNNIFFFTCPP